MRSVLRLEQSGRFPLCHQVMHFASVRTTVNVVAAGWVCVHFCFLPVDFGDPLSTFLWASSLLPVAVWSLPGKASLTSRILIACVHSVVQCGTGDSGVRGMLTSECPCSRKQRASCSLRWPENKLDFRVLFNKWFLCWSLQLESESLLYYMA